MRFQIIIDKVGIWPKKRYHPSHVYKATYPAELHKGISSTKCILKVNLSGLFYDNMDYVLRRLQSERSLENKYFRTTTIS